MLIFKYGLFVFLTLHSTMLFAGATKWMDFKLDDGHVKVAIKTSGIDGFAILDTGAQINSINSAFIKKNQLEYEKGRSIQVKGVYGVSKREAYNNVPVEFLGSDLALNDLVKVFLGHHSNQLLLGAGFFNNFVVQLDYPSKKIRLVTRDAIKMSELANVEMKFDRASGHPIVKIGLNDDTSAWLVLDTGNSGGLLLKRSLANSYSWLDKFETSTSTAMGVNATGVNEVFRLPTVKIGPFTLENVLTSVPAKNQKNNIFVKGKSNLGSRIQSKNIKGLLGYDVLKHFIVTIDYKGGHMHISAP